MMDKLSIFYLIAVIILATCVAILNKTFIVALGVLVLWLGVAYIIYTVTFPEEV